MIKEVIMARQDEIAEKAVRKSTLKSLKEKKRSRIRQLKADYDKTIQEINIQYSEDPERLKAKYAAAEYAKNEKAKKRAEKRIENEQKIIELEKSKVKFVSHVKESYDIAVISGGKTFIVNTEDIRIDTRTTKGKQQFKEGAVTLVTRVN